MTILAAEPQPTGIDDLDGLPVGLRAEGSPLVPGHAAWERLGVGHRCETWLAWSGELFAPAVVKLPHPVLPRLYADGTHADEPYVVVEYVDGPALGDAVADDGPLAPLDVAVLRWQLLAGLRTLHARGVAHLDLKPDNVVLRAGRPVLVDFGSARPLGAPCFDPDRPAADRGAPSPLPRSGTADLVHALLAVDPAARPDPAQVLAGFGAVLARAGRPAWPAWVTPTRPRVPA